MKARLSPEAQELYEASRHLKHGEDGWDAWYVHIEAVLKRVQEAERERCAKIGLPQDGKPRHAFVGHGDHDVPCRFQGLCHGVDCVKTESDPIHVREQHDTEGEKP